jgi:arylsulfatase A-like enzyme
LNSDCDVARDCLWWLHEGNRAIRVGDWKLVAAGNQGAWELYNLAVDRCEANDLTASHAEKARELERLWQQTFDEIHQLAKRDLPAAKP